MINTQSMLLYQGNIIRPPSEANSIILQVTTGCSHNKCTFCGAYKDKLFTVRLTSLAADLSFASRYCTRQTRVFLADGDALVLPYDQLKHTIETIRQSLPWVRRISLYANGRAIRSKTEKQLTHLKELGLDRVYLGLESGHNEVLKSIQKGETPQSMIAAAKKINGCGLFLSVTVLLGIAGAELSDEHGRATGAILSAMSPQQIAALTLMPLPKTPLYQEIEKGAFVLPDTWSLLRELKTIICSITLEKTQFYANHASNYLPLSGRLLRDRQKMVNMIDQALNGSVALIDDELRTL